MSERTALPTRPGGSAAGTCTGQETNAEAGSLRFVVSRARVYNGGTYDLLHPGHIDVIRQCRRLAGTDGQVVIGLNTDAFVAEFKGHPTVQTLEERIVVMSALRDVDWVAVNEGGRDSRPVLELVRPDIIAVGRDWYSPDDSRYCAQMGLTPEWLRERGIRLVYMDWTPGYSSTNLRHRSVEVTA